MHGNGKWHQTTQPANDLQHAIVQKNGFNMFQLESFIAPQVRILEAILNGWATAGVPRGPRLVLAAVENDWRALQFAAASLRR